MAEAWLEEEEEELRDSAGNRRHRRSNLNQATERPERNKPEHRFSGQGPLSSIRAVIKRTSRTTAQSEQQRDRRRPEITIVAAEPIGPGSWFHGGPPGGLGFPPPPPPQWRPSDSHHPEPPSYEQVIKEINQVQVTTPSANVEPRRTTTCATQTDFPLEDDRPGPGNNVIQQPQPVLCDQATITVQRTERPERPRQPVPFVKNHVQDSGHQIAISNTAGTSTRHEDTNVPNIIRYPVPRPRTKPNLKPLGNNLSIFQGNSEFFQATVEGELPSSQSCPGFDDNFLEELFEMNNMSHERSQNSITARIKAFESQGDSTEPPRRPEIAPRSINTRSGVPGKPSVAPKPFSNRTSGEWEPGKDNKPKCTPREGLVPTSLSDSGGVTKPELPKKPKSSVVKSSGEIPDVLLGTSVSGINSKESDRIIPVPAPRPILPKKTLQTDNSVPVGAKPLIPAPKFSIATQAKAFNAVETPGTRAPGQVTQSKSVGELDLISFDDEVLPPVLPSPEVNDSNANSDPFQLFSKDETEKEQPGPSVILRKPTVIRISGKLGKSCEELQAPPPLPTEKPVGLYNKCAARARPAVRKEWETFDSTEEPWTKPVLPTRPAGVKVMETAQQPPLKGPPGRPPPPKLSRNASNRDAFPRSSSDASLGAKQNTSGINRSKSQVLKRQQPDLPPRPKPGHPLYNKYTLPLPHGLAEKDIVASNPRELSCKRGEVLVLLEQTDNSHIHCQKGGIIGDVKVTNMKIITPLDDSVENRQKDVLPRMEDSHTPHALVLHDYAGEHEDDLSLSSGEIVYLLEKVDKEWYRGKCKGNTGIFPANHIRVVVDVPEKLNPKRHSSASILKGPRCVARFEFIGDQKDELSFSEGDTIVLKEYINDEWAKGELRGHMGIFPINFVEILEELPSKTSDVRNSHKIKLPGLSSQQTGDWCEALFDFAAEAEDDLSFKKGDKILITERLDLEWYKGRLNGREGILPAAFVQICSGPTARQTQGGKLGKARALYDFCGENDDELSFKAGDDISSLESVDNDWMSGELHGRTGIFPKNFVQRC